MVRLQWLHISKIRDPYGPEAENLVTCSRSEPITVPDELITHPLSDNRKSIMPPPRPVLVTNSGDTVMRPPTRL